jgi:hypothetical protein
MSTQIAAYPTLAAWTDEGEELAYITAHLPYRIGEWYIDGVRQFGAPAIIQAIEANRAALLTGGKPAYPYLAQTKLRTIQSYASVTRAIKAHSRYSEYEFWHVEAVLGIPDEETRIKLLNEGKAEQMSVGKFRKHRDEELGKLAPPPDSSVASLNGKVASLEQANHDLNDAVRDYAAQFAEIQARAADYDPPAMTYSRGADHAEWVTGRAICPRCGALMRCPECEG